jgi:glucose-1-phosphate thymidylyltransferase
VSNAAAVAQIKQCLGDGSQWGLSLSYAVQSAPQGIAHGFLAAADLVDGHPVASILGANIFYRSGLPIQLRRAAARERGATIFAVPVSEPQHFGIVVIGSSNRATHIEEKPKAPRSNLAIPGLYFYDERALEFARALKPSARGEFEITDLNRIYLDCGDLFVEELGRGSAWLDGGSPEDLYEAGQFVRVMEERTGLKIACPEEVAFRLGFIDGGDLAHIVKKMPNCHYRTYLAGLLDAP